MVNKQYNVQPARKQPSHTNGNPSAHPVTTVNGTAVNNLDKASGGKLQSQPQQPRSPSNALLGTIGGAAYARNIAYIHNHDHQPDSGRSEVTEMFANDERLPHLNQKDLAIKDIGRFQYILQMDREMASHPNSPAYRLHPQHNNINSSNTSASSAAPASHCSSSNLSNNSTLFGDRHPLSTEPYEFWKADGCRIGHNSASAGSHRFVRMHRWTQTVLSVLSAFWSYAKWPLAALFACSVVATLVYFAVLMNADDAGNGAFERPMGDMHQTDFVRFDAIQRQQPYRPEPIASNALDERDESITGRLAIFVQSSSADRPIGQHDDDAQFTDDDLLLAFPLDTAEQYDDESDDDRLTGPSDDIGLWSGQQQQQPIETSTSDDRFGATHRIQPVETAGQPTSAPIDTPKRFRNTQIMEISTPRLLVKNEPDDDDRRPNALSPKSTLMFPTRETFEIFGFTSGHQNSFGVPIEEDERMLRMLNEQLRQAEAAANALSTSASSSTTDATMLRTHVSPTLPNIRHTDAAGTTERQPAAVDPSDEGICESTSLSLCRSILPYDLTSAQHSHANLSVQDVDHFKYLVASRCSDRAHEFICSVLQPECRPERMGILRPCKRSCKAILEPCGHVIAASEFLTAAFDCDAFPDSSDPDVCRDGTRQTECQSNEFRCDDDTCIPSQWRCDNIKDCSAAEDEMQCTFCAHDEFRCPNTDKCIPHKWRCDDYDDCPDAADEEDCLFDNDGEDDEVADDESRTLLTSTSSDGHGRTFPYTQELSASRAAQGPTTQRTAVSHRPRPPAETDREVLQAEASGVSVPLSKSLANFQDSKEIMMTSDSETDFKFATRSSDGADASETPTKMTATSTSAVPVLLRAEEPALAGPHRESPCPVGELRCISGTCITVSQLCDKVTDCPDGADEAMCVYKTLDIQ